MNKEIPIASRTRAQIDSYLKQPGHALLICGPAGSGKGRIAEDIAAKLLDVSTHDVASHPFFVPVKKPAGKQDIPIDEIRAVIKRLQLKPTGHGGKARRVILIESAQLLNREAQNALLKALEEPPPATAFVLTAASAEELLPTISSRVQKILVAPITRQDAMEYYHNHFTADEINSAWSLSGGAARLMDALLSENNGHELKKAVSLAKEFLSMNRYDRVIYLDKLSSNKTDLLLFFDSLSRIYASLQASAIIAGYSLRSRKLLACRRMVIEASARILKNASVKIVCLDMALKLPL